VNVCTFKYGSFWLSWNLGEENPIDIRLECWSFLAPSYHWSWGGGRRGRNRTVVGFTTTPMQPVPITTDVVSSNSDQGTVYNIVCHWLAAGRGFSPGTPVSSTNKTARHDITEILLKVALSTKKKPTPKNQSLTW
jgi:hypothetical protein